MRAVPASVSAPSKVCRRAAASPDDVSKRAMPKPPCPRDSSLPPTRRQRACAALAVRITNHESRVTAVLAVPALPCAGGLPPQRPPCNATVCAPPQLTRQPPGGNATVRAIPACRRRAASVRARRSQFESRITSHESRLTAVLAVPALPCAGGHPPQRPPCNSTVCSPPQLTRQPPGGNATMCARFQLVVNAPRTRCGRRCASPIPPFEFRVSAVSDHYPLSTIPCTSLQNVLYCRVESEHTQAGPERAAYTHMPAHHAQATNHVDLLRTERPNPAPGELRSGLCRERLEMRRTAVRRAAHPQCNDTRHAAHAGAAGTRLCILSRKARSCRCFAHFRHSKRHILRVFTTKATGTDRGRILLRESMPISCHENAEKFFKVGPNRPKQAIQYPIDTLSVPDFPEIRSHFTTQYDALGSILDRFGPNFCAHARLHRQGD